MKKLLISFLVSLTLIYAGEVQKSLYFPYSGITRDIGMPQTAFSNMSTSLYYNPSNSILFLKERNAHLFLQNGYHETGFYFYRVNGDITVQIPEKSKNVDMAFSQSYNFLIQDDVLNGGENETFKDKHYTSTFSVSIKDALALGVSVKPFVTTPENFGGSGVAFDAGFNFQKKFLLQKENTLTTSIGATIANMSILGKSSADYLYIPVHVRSGIAAMYRSLMISGGVAFDYEYEFSDEEFHENTSFFNWGYTIGFTPVAELLQGFSAKPEFDYRELFWGFNIFFDRYRLFQFIHRNDDAVFNKRQIYANYSFKKSYWTWDDSFKDASDSFVHTWSLAMSFKALK